MEEFIALVNTLAVAYDTSEFHDIYIYIYIYIHTYIHTYICVVIHCFSLCRFGYTSDLFSA
jgi:hypothetical protein